MLNSFSEVLIIFPTFLLGAYLAVASWIDIKTHEVPDWISYSLVAAGLLFAAAKSVVLADLSIVWSALGALVGFGIGALLYFTGQWGGGDAKLLSGVGAIFGLNALWFKDVLAGNFIPMPAFIWFLGFLLIAGAVYGIIWMLVLMIIHFKKFFPAFKAKLASLRWQRIVTLSCVALLLAAAVYTGFKVGFSFGIPVIGLAALVYAAFYLAVAVQTVESTVMLHATAVKDLTEGDWVVGGFKVGKKWIIPKSNTGVTLEQIALAKKTSPRAKVIVKHGIPFVPSFFLAYGGIIVLSTF